MSATDGPFAARPSPMSPGVDAMNTGHRPHPAAPRIPLIVPIAVLFAAIFGVVYALAPFFGGRPDGVLATILGAPLTALFLLATVALTSWWFLTGEVRQARSALLALALVLLPLAGLLATIQGVDPVERRWGGVAGRNLAWFMLRILETGPVVSGLFYGGLLAFGLYFLRAALAAAASPVDASAILARLARSRTGLDAAVAEITPPSADEALGLARPVGADRDLFAPDAEILTTPVAASEDESTPETAFLSAPEDETPIAIEEPPPPPRRRRVLEDIVSEEEFAAEERPEDSTIVAVLPDAAGRSEVGLHEIFGQGVIDAEDDEDVLTPPNPAATAEAPTAGAASQAPIVAEAEDDEDDSDLPEPLSVLLDQAAARVPSGVPAADDRESVEDAVEASADREEERPLFAPPPRLLPFEDDDVGDVDDLPTDDDASARRVAEPFTDAATTDKEPEPLADAFAFDPETPTPPPARYDADIEGSRTGETPRRALREVSEDTANEATTAAATDAGLFDETEASTDAAAPPKRKRTRSPRQKSVVERDEAFATPGGSADADDAEASFRLAGKEPTAAIEAATEPDVAPAAAEVAETPTEADRTPAAAEIVEIPERAAAPPPAPAVSRTRRPEPATPVDDFELLVSRATEVVVAAERCSPSLLQRELGIRFVEAAAVIERLHQRGIVGPHTPSGVREVLGREGAAGA